MKNSLYIKNIKKKGRGVFSSYAIDAGILIESCPAIFIKDENERQILKSTLLGDYLFYWDEAKTISAIALGFGSLYNHSLNPNAYYVMNNESREIEFFSLIQILPHQEITVNYTGNVAGTSLEWFTLRNLTYLD